MNNRITYEKFITLYNENYNDKEISEILKINYKTIQSYRLYRKLPPNRKNEDKFIIKDPDQIINLFNNGYSKQEMCEILNIKPNTLTGYLRRLKLNILERNKNLRKEITGSNLNIIIGALLGDSAISKNGEINFTHSLKQLEYLNFKYELLKDLDLSNNKISTRYDKRTNKYYHSSSFRIKPTKLSKELRKSLYIPKKIITKEILEYYNIQSMAIHYMDDGTMIKPYHVKYHFFATDGFDLSSIELLKTHIEDNFNLKCKIRKVGINNDKYQLYISGKESNLRFENLIKPYCCESMYYKI
jgi:DNA-binding CsgD family transcriptional regulator